MAKSSSEKRYTLYLINPRFKYKHYAAQQEASELIGKERMTVPIQLPLIAAMTPDHYDIKIVEDDAVDVRKLPPPDLVGITSIAASASRVLELADYYQSVNVPVVLGGSFASFMTDECLEHADHVFVGEAEGIWQKFLQDFEKGEAKPVYKNDTPPAFETSPMPRWDLVNTNTMMSIGVETSRGCSFKCNFCVVNKMFGRKMRFRDVDDVIAEIAALPLKRVFFLADNFALKKSYARNLVSRLKPLGITWICQTGIDVAEDEALLKEMSEAGCISILIGFESLNEICLKDIQKHQNHVADFDRAVKRIHDHGIHVLGSFIIGFDSDTMKTFEYIYEFIQRNNLVYSMLNVLSVAPGTELFRRMQAEGRIHVVDPSYRNGLFPCIRYNHFTQREILDGFFGTLEKLFSWKDIAGRGIRLFENGTFLRGGNDNPPFWDKLTISLMLIRRFAFSKNSHKRRMFFALFRMARKKKLSMNDLVIFLLNMEGYHLYNTKAKEYLPEVRRAVGRIDALIAAEAHPTGSLDTRPEWIDAEAHPSLRS